MSFRAAGNLLISASLAVSAVTAGAAPLPAGPSPSTTSAPVTLATRSGAVASPTVHRSRRRYRRHRVPPEGGVYSRNAILLDPMTG